MANTIAKAAGYDSTRIKRTQRLGSVAAQTQAATWRTFVDVTVNASGSLHIEVTRDGQIVHTFQLEAEADN